MTTTPEGSPGRVAQDMPSGQGTAVRPPERPRAQRVANLTSPAALAKPLDPPKRGKASASGGGRLRALDGLRLIAALMVALYHYGGRNGTVGGAWGKSPQHLFPTLHYWFSYGPLGVQIFFVISGFVICMSGWARPLRSFFASRASRLMPAYWAAVMLVTAVFALPHVMWKTVSPSDGLVNMTLLQEPIGAARVLGVDWTLWVEVRFYALFALLLVLPGVTRRRVVLFCSVWTMASAIAQAADEPLLNLVLMPQYSSYFIGGMGLYLLHRNRRDTLAWGIVIVSWLIGQHYAVLSLWRAPDPHAFANRSVYVIILIVTAGYAMVAAIALGALKWADWPWLTVAGALTYPFYLVHEHLGWVVIQKLHGSLGVPAQATFVLTIVTMLVLAWLLNRYVEKWATPLLRRSLSTPLSDPPAPAAH